MSKVIVLEEVCPRCRTSNYQNKALRLLVNECGHEICEKCVEHLFIRGSAPCPTCKIILKKNTFKTKRFEDHSVEREVDIRKRVLKDYNKTQENFSTLDEFNDYLEEIEEIVFNFTNNVDIEETKRRVEQYKKDNFKVIERNRAEQSRQDAYLKEKMRAEQKEIEERRQHEKECEAMDEMERNERKKKLIEQIANSDRPADEILLLHKEEEEEEGNSNILKKRSLHSKSSVNSGFSVTMLSSTKPSNITIYNYKYEDPRGQNLGPTVPLDKIGDYAENLSIKQQSLTAGFSKKYAVHRPIDEAYSGLFIFK